MTAMSRGERFAASLRSWGAGRRWMRSATERASARIRARLGRPWLSGTGIEIGAQMNPLWVDPQRARVRYLDRQSAEDNARLHGLDPARYVKVDLFDDGATLTTVADASLDFVISNHVLEHVLDPLSALKAWLRVLKPGGLLYLSLPNFVANEFDFERRPPDMATLEALHARRDDKPFVDAYRRARWRDFLMAVEKLGDGTPALDRRAAEIEAADERIHFHVYSPELARQLVAWAHRDVRPLEVLDVFAPEDGYETIVVLRAAASPGSLAWPHRAWREAALTAYARLRS